jgi:integrase
MRDVVNPTGKHRPKRRHHGEGSRAFRVRDARRRKPWRCDLRLGRDPLTGRLRTKSFWGTSAEEAEAERDAYLARLRRAGSASAAERTVAALLADWMDEKRPDLDPSTARRYAAAIDDHLVPTPVPDGRETVRFGDLLVADVTEEHVQAARGAWRNKHKGPHEGEPLSSSSSNLVLGVLKQAMGREAPAVRRRRKTPYGGAVYLTSDQARTLLEALSGDTLELIVKVALAVGPRRGEVLGIRWPDLDLEAGTWTTGRQVRFIPPEARLEGEGPYRLVRPKADHSMGRVIGLPAFVVAALQAHREEWERRRKRAAMWARPGDLVFCDDRGQALPPGTVSRRFKARAKSALGIDMRLHDTRHSAGTLMLAMGVPERVVQDILGHSDGRTTRGYMHVTRQLGSDAAERMDRALREQMPANMATSG